MTLLFLVILFFFGAIFGSFAGVIIERGRGGFDFERLPAIFLGRSHCPGCEKKSNKDKKKKKSNKTNTLTRWQLIPIFGWLIQGGKCFRCKQKIPAWYMGFEIVMGLSFVAVALLIPNFEIRDMLAGGASWRQLLFWIFVVRASIGIFVADILWYELNVWLRLFLLIRIVARGATGFFDLQSGLIWMLVLFVIFVGIYRFGKRYVKTIFQQEGEGFGQGDVMLAILVGLLFPFVISGMELISQIQMVLLYLVTSSFIGMIFRYVRFLLTKDKDNMMPFLPAMMVGFIVILVWGEALVGLL